MQKQQYQFNFDGFDPIFELNNPKNDPLFIGRDTPNCAFCDHSYENEDQLKRLGPIYGPFKKKKDKQKYYVHHMCALWSDGVYISDEDKLQNIEKEIKKAQSEKCLLCNQYGASLKCHQMDCKIIYHSRCFLLRYEQFLQEIPIFQPRFYFYCEYHKRLAEKDKNFLEEAQIEWVEQICYKCEIIDCEIICDKCDKTFHLQCAGLESDPKTDIWFCEYCTGKSSNQKLIQTSNKKKKNERVIEDD